MLRQGRRITFLLLLLLGCTVALGASAEVITFGLTVVVTPAPPTSLGATAISASQINLSWSDNSSNEDGFAIERKLGSGGSYVQIATTGSNIATYSDTGLSAATTYFYRVSSFNTDGSSIYSDEVSATTASSGVTPSGGGGGGGAGGGGAPSTVTAALLRGVAYPGSLVSLLKDAQLVATTTANASGAFQFSLSNLTAGMYNFGVWAQDARGNRSLTIGFNIVMIGGMTNTVSGIFLPPIIAIDKSEVKRGDILTIYGQSASEARINLLINSSNTLYKDASADANGLWTYKFNTEEIELGDHTTRAKALKDNEASTYSQPLPFKVGSKNVAIKPSDKCPLKGDLNNDCRVNLVDFSIAAYWWKRPLTERARSTVDGKLFSDGVINLRDFSVMAYYWTG